MSFFTGFLNLTIDKAPTNPKDKAIFPEITFVIIKVMGGNKAALKVKCIVDAHLCFESVRACLINNPKKDVIKGLINATKEFKFNIYL